MCINEITVPESIKALNHFPTWTVTVGQSKTSPVVNWWIDDCPLIFESSSLLEDGSCSLNDQSSSDSEEEFYCES